MITHKDVLRDFRYEPNTGKLFRIFKTHEREYTYINSEGYLPVKYKLKTYKAHRLIYFIMLGVWPPDEIDHEDRVRHNNIWSNLHAATRKQNANNCGMQSNNTSGCRGVNFSNGSWVVRYRKKYIGRFKDYNTAVAIRKRIEKEIV